MRLDLIDPDELASISESFRLPPDVRKYIAGYINQRLFDEGEIVYTSMPNRESWFRRTFEQGDRFRGLVIGITPFLPIRGGK